MARAEAGMSVLAKAADLLDIKDSEDGSGSVRSYSDNSSSNESFARPYGRLPGYRHHDGVPDHGSTPPGSASPPPSGGSAGGATAAGEDVPSFGGGGGGNGQAFASAFALGTGETVRTGEQGYRDGCSGGDRGGTGGAGGAVAGGGGGSPLQRPGWLVGPGGVQQRRSLQSVPGPWRPYWKDSSGGGGGGGNEGCVGAAAAAGAALRQHGGDEMKR